MRTTRFHMRVAGLLLLAAASELWSAAASHAPMSEACRIGTEGSPIHLPALLLYPSPSGASDGGTSWAEPRAERP